MKMDYSLGALTNVATLLLGLLLGFALGTSRQSSAHAQETTVASHPTVEEITPNITTGSVAFHTLLTHRISTDELVVAGYDMLKMDEGIFNLLKSKTLTSNSEVDAVVERAIAPIQLHLKPPPAPTQTPPAAQTPPTKKEDSK